MIFGQFRFLLVFVSGLVFAPSAFADRSEVVFWESIANSTDGEEYCAYMTAYPKGKFAALARIRAKKFSGSCTVAGTIGAQSISPKSTITSLPLIEKSKKTKSFFASDNYFEGKMAFDTQNYKEAIQLWSESAEQGHPEAQGLVGGMYHAGLGVTKNYERAMDWYHYALVHPGWNRMEQSIRSMCTWPGLRTSVQAYCKPCDKCQRSWTHHP